MIVYMIPDIFKRLPELAILGACLAASIIFFSAVNPQNVPPALLMVGFVLVVGILYSCLKLLARALRLQDRLRPGQYKGFLFTGTVLPVLLLALQSLGQLTVRDVVTLVLLFAIGFFYISRASGRKV
jgi:predicted membrane channel-forming protein YqfA (hemolysin III family)